MDLKEFVETTLGQLVAGIASAQTTIEEHGGVLNPGSIAGGSPSNRLFIADSGRNVSLVEFEVSISVTKEGKIAAGIGFSLAGAEAGIGGSKGSKIADVGRVSFSLPIAFPGE